MGSLKSIACLAALYSLCWQSLGGGEWAGLCGEGCSANSPRHKVIADWPGFLGDFRFDPPGSAAVVRRIDYQEGNQEYGMPVSLGFQKERERETS